MVWNWLIKTGLDIILSVLFFCIFLDTVGCVSALLYAMVPMTAIDMMAASERLVYRESKIKEAYYNGSKKGW